MSYGRRDSYGYSNSPLPIEDPLSLAPRATTRQIDYIMILANDLGFDLKRRQAHTRELCKRRITFLDELTKSEASSIIMKFLEWKSQR